MKSKRFLSIILVVMMVTTICFSSAASPVTLEAAQASVTNFITRSGDMLMDGSNEFRFISANTPTLTMIEDIYWHLPDPWEQEDAIKALSQMGAGATRTYTLSVKKTSDDASIIRHVMGPNQFSEEAFIALDHAVALAHQYGVRLIIPFVDQYSWWGGITEYASFRGKTADAFWTDTQIKQDFKDTITHLLNRVNTVNGLAYKEDPAILAWETGNELVPANHQWTAEMAEFIKSLDQNHLIIDGKYGIDSLSLDDPNIDIVSNHYYPEKLDYVAQCNSDRNTSKGKKAFIVGEFGFKKPADIGNLFNSIIENGTTGAMIWSLRFQNKDGGFYPHTEGSRDGIFYCSYRWPGFPSGDSYYETQTLKLIREKAYNLRGIATENIPVVPAPNAPVLKNIEWVSNITWQGATGASSYDIYRSTSDSGPWDLIGGDFSFTLEDPQYFSDTTALSGSQYYYKVVAKNSSGVSADSNIVGPVVAKHAIVDNINGGAYYVEWGKFFDHSADLAYDGQNIPAYGGDYFRIKKLPSSEPQYVTYAVPTSTTFDTTPTAVNVEAYFSPSETGDFHILTSSDGIAFTEYTGVSKTVIQNDPNFPTKVLYSGNSIPAATRFIKVAFPTDSEAAKAELGKVTIDYPTDGSMLSFPKPAVGNIITDGILIDEMNNMLKMDSHSGSLGFETGDDYGYFGGDTKRLTESTNNQQWFTYKAGADMNYFKFSTFSKQNPSDYVVPDFNIFTSPDGVTYSEYTKPEIKRKGGDGWWEKEDYTGYTLPAGTRYLKFQFPLLDEAHSGSTWMTQFSRMEVGIGSATIPAPPTDKKTNIIDSFEGYSGSNVNFIATSVFNPWGCKGGVSLDAAHKNNGSYGMKLEMDFDTQGPNTGTGWGGYDRVIDDADWSGNSGIQFWVDPNGQVLPLKLQFSEKSGEKWVTQYDLKPSDTAGTISIPFSSFWREEDAKNNTIDLNAITSFGIYSWGSGDHIVYLDSIGLYKLNEIDNFESYGGNNSKLQAAFVSHASGDNVTVTLDTSNKNDGNYGMKYEYTIGSNGWGGIIKTLNHSDWSGFNGLQFWLKPDGSNRNLAVQFKETNGDYWKAQLALSGTEPKLIQLPFTSFFRPSWQGGSATMDLEAIDEFGLFVDGAPQGIGAIYFDSIEPVKLPTIDDFDGYNGSNENLQTSFVTHPSGDPVTVSLESVNKNDGAFSMKFDYNLTDSNGWGGIIKTLPKMNWNGYNAISFWVKPDGTSRGIKLQFKEASGEYWSATYDLTGTEPQLIKIPIAGFTRPAWSSGNGIIDINAITELGIYIDKGPSPAGSGTLYFDSIKVTSIPVIDNFNYYDGGELVSEGVYVRNQFGNSLTLTPDASNKSEGKFGLRYEYTLDASKNFAGVTKNLNGADWFGYNGLQFWLKPDGSNNKMVIQFKEPNSEAWETYINLSGTEPRLVTIPFTDFKYPPWYTGGANTNGKIDLEAINEFSIYINLQEGGVTGSNAIYLDDIKLINIVPDTTPPTVPTSLEVVARTDNMALLMWSPSEDKVKVEGYEIYRDNVKIATTTKLYFLDKELSQHTTYTYIVKAYDPVGNVSDESNKAVVTTLINFSVNFQPGSYEIPNGYVSDNGGVYGSRNGFNYGWNIDHTTFVYDRNKNVNQALDTDCRIQKAGKWEIEVPDGDYMVTVSIGDAEESTKNSIYVEGKEYWKNEKLPANKFAEESVLVTVKDGRLTIDQGKDNKDLESSIDYVKIKEIFEIPAQYLLYFNN